jgi:hypothetical protein
VKNKNYLIASIYCFILMCISNISYAVCPICTVFVGAGVGLSRWLGVDDTISGLWIGGLIVSMIGWTIDWCNRHNIRFLFRKISIIILYYALIVIPLYRNEAISHPLNNLWGYNKLMLGIVVGSIMFFIGYLWHLYLKINNENKSFFPFQKVIIPLLYLIIATILFYFLTQHTVVVK